MDPGAYGVSAVWVWAARVSDAADLCYIRGCARPTQKPLPGHHGFRVRNGLPLISNERDLAGYSLSAELLAAKPVWSTQSESRASWRSWLGGFQLSAAL